MSLEGAPRDDALVSVEEMLCSYGDEHRLVVAIDEALRGANVPARRAGAPLRDLKTVLVAYGVDVIFEEDGSGHEYLKALYQRNIVSLVPAFPADTGLGFTRPIPLDAPDAAYATAYTKGFLLRPGSYEALTRTLCTLARLEPGRGAVIALAPSSRAVVVTDTALRLRAWEALIGFLDPG